MSLVAYRGVVGAIYVASVYLQSLCLIFFHFGLIICRFCRYLFVILVDVFIRVVNYMLSGLRLVGGFM